MISLEQLFDGSSSARNFDALMRLVIDTGGLSAGVRFGLAGTGTWPGASPRANNTAVTHGLGAVPVAVFATVTSSPSATWFPVLATTSYGATTFSFTAVTSDGSSPASATGYSIAWLAIG